MFVYILSVLRTFFLRTAKSTGNLPDACHIDRVHFSVAGIDSVEIILEDNKTVAAV